MPTERPSAESLLSTEQCPSRAWGGVHSQRCSGNSSPPCRGAIINQTIHDMQQIEKINLPNKSDRAGERRAVLGASWCPISISQNLHRTRAGSCQPHWGVQDGELPSWLPWAQGNQHFMLVNVSWRLLSALILLVLNSWDSKIKR